MALRTVLVTRHWTLDRPNERARVSCDVALVQDDHDRGFYEVRIALNGPKTRMGVVLSGSGATRAQRENHGHHAHFRNVPQQLRRFVGRLGGPVHCENGDPRHLDLSSGIAAIVPPIQMSAVKKTCYLSSRLLTHVR
jgi:hypothetical protein